MAFWDGVQSVVLRAGEEKKAIAVNRPTEAASLLDNLSKRGVPRVSALVTFAAGDPSKINFSLKGLATARIAAKKCLAEAAAAHTAPSQGKLVTVTLAAFLQSPMAKKYGITKVSNESLRAAEEPTLRIGVQTKNDQIVSITFTVGNARRPDTDQIALMNAFLAFAATAVGAPRVTVQSADFSKEYQTNTAGIPARHFGRLDVRTGVVGEPVLSVDFKP